MENKKSMFGVFRCLKNDKCPLEELTIRESGSITKVPEDGYTDAIEIHGSWKKEENSNPLSIQVTWNSMTGSGMEMDIPPRSEIIKFSEDMKSVFIGGYRLEKQ